MPLRPRLLTSSCIALAALMSVMATPSQAEAPQGEVRQSTPFTLSSGTARTPEQMAVRFDAANLAFDIQPDTKTVQAHARLDFTATAPVAAIVLELDSRFSIDGIQVGDQDITDWSNPEGRLTIPLPRPLEAGESVSVNVAYGGVPHTATRAPWDGGWVWSESSGKPWIATAIQGEGCDLIWPCIDHPMGEPARVDMHITVPKGLSAPANGKLVGVQEHGDGSTTWHWTTRDPNTYAITLNVGPYQELSGQYQSRYGNSIPMAFWALDSVPREKAQGLFDQLPQMLAFFEEWVGPYPFADEKIGLVETPHLGMEHQTLNAYGNGYKLDGKGYDWLLQHELAHEWFGNQMTNVSWDDMWLHEGFGTYMQPLYARWLNGERAMQAELETMRRTITNRFPMVSGQPQDAATVYKAETGPALDLYYKGALIAHTLRLYMGDEAFKQSLRELVYGTPEPQPGQITTQYRTTAHYITIVSALMAKDMSWFFDAYLYQAALPELVMERQGDVVRLSWKTPAKQPFIMPVEIEIDGTIYTVEMKDGSAIFSTPARAHILLDPHSKVLRHLPHIEAWKREGSR